MARWGDEKTLQFIHLYRKRECLWNPRSPLYKNKISRDDAYNSILQEFKDKNLDIKSVKTKIKNLRSVYHTELKKVRYATCCSNGSAAYRPSLTWFDAMHAFLADSVEERHESAAATTPTPTSCLVVTHEMETEVTVDDSTGASSQDTTIVHSTFEAEDPDTDPAEEILPDSQPCTVTKTPSSSEQQYVKPIKRKVFRRNRPHVDNTVLTALQRLENKVASVVSSSRQEPTSTSSPEDEFHLFALSVAAQLRQLPLHVAVATQNKIQNTLSEARLAAIFSNKSASPNVSVKIEDLSN